MNKIEIIIPKFIQEVKMSDKRMKKYYKEGSKIPDKFLDVDKLKLKFPYEWKKGKLYNTITKEQPFSNTGTAGLPRFKSIAGNDIWYGNNEFWRAEVTRAVKTDFTPHMPTTLGNIKYPILISMEVHVSPRFCNWDIGNLWLYEKIFGDLLQELGLIPNDNIMYITKGGGPRYIPIVNDEDRKMVFTLEEDSDPRVINHVMYNLNVIKPYELIFNGEVITEHQLDSYLCSNMTHLPLKVIATTEGNPGSTFYDKGKGLIYISVGRKKLIWGAVRKALSSIFSLCIQQNAHLVIKKEFFDQFKQFVDEELRQKGLKIYIYEDSARNSISGN